jgi:hypothetical protein
LSIADRLLVEFASLKIRRLGAAWTQFALPAIDRILHIIEARQQSYQLAFVPLGQAEANR